MVEKVVLRFSFEMDAEICKNCGFIPAKSAVASARVVSPGKIVNINK
jgi:hypothetical protein